MSKITRTATERMVITLTDNSEEVMNALKNAISRGLASIGDTGSRHAKDIITAEGRVDTGRMRNSISFEPKEPKTFVAIGTNVEYAPYQELGTSRGIKPAYFLTRAAENYKEEYKRLLTDSIENA